MLKPVMHKHFITITLCLLCLLVARPAEARLTLGVVTGPGAAAGEVTSVQAGSLASLLAEKLQEEVVVKELADSATLLNWLERFAMIDLALLSTKVVEATPADSCRLDPSISKISLTWSPDRVLMAICHNALTLLCVNPVFRSWVQPKRLFHRKNKVWRKDPLLLNLG